MCIRDRFCIVPRASSVSCKDSHRAIGGILLSPTRDPGYKVIGTPAGTSWFSSYRAGFYCFCYLSFCQIWPTTTGHVKLR